jgi:acetyl esterase
VDVLARLTGPMREALAVSEAASERIARELPPITGPADARAWYAAERAHWNEGGPLMHRTVDGTVDGPDGPVPVRWYHPTEQDARLPVLVYAHGGGFVLGDLDTHDRIVRTLAATTGSVAVAVDYTLAPEARFPRALHECVAVARAAADRARSLGVTGPAIALAGDSAGAGLALGTALHLRDHDGPALASLLLYYGMYGLRDSVSRRLLGGPWDGLSPAEIAGFLEAYLASPADLSSPYVDCLSADLGHGLPPTYLLSCALDPLHDDSTALAALLTAAGVPHRHDEVDGVLHGFLHLSRLVPEAAEALRAGAVFHLAAITP